MEKDKYIQLLVKRNKEQKENISFLLRKNSLLEEQIKEYNQEGTVDFSKKVIGLISEVALLKEEISLGKINTKELEGIIEKLEELNKGKDIIIEEQNKVIEKSKNLLIITSIAIIILTVVLLYIEVKYKLF